MGKRVTINTLAKQLGVNPSTVSRAFVPDSNISDEVREKILKLAEKEGYKPNKAASRLTMKELKIGILINDTYPECMPEVTRGFKDAYERFYDYKISYEILTFKTDEQDSAHAKHYFEKFSDCEGLIVSGLTSDEMAEELRRYSETHRNIVAMQSETHDTKYLFSSAHDGAASAKIAAGFLSLTLKNNKEKKVVLFTGSNVLEVHKETKAAFEHTAKETGLNLIAVYDMNDDEELLLRQATEVFEKEAPNGIYISSGKSLALCKLVEEKGLADKVTIVTSDTYPALNKYLENGTVKATVYQNFHDLAYNAFALLTQSIVDRAEIPTKVSPRPELVIKTNLFLYR